jgi:hypothetical protein
VAVALANVLDSSNSLFLGFVGKHGSKRAITDGADVRNLGAVFLVDDQAAPLVHLETNVVETESVGVRAATDSNEDDVGVELSLLAHGQYFARLNSQSPPFRPWQPRR